MSITPVSGILTASHWAQCSYCIVHQTLRGADQQTTVTAACMGGEETRNVVARQTAVAVAGDYALTKGALLV